MKKAFFWALLLTVSMTACKGGKSGDAATEKNEPAVGLAIDENHFPDPGLRGAIAKTSSGEDDILTDYEIEDFWLLDVNYGEVASLKGIELLPNLSSLHVNGFQGTTIDVSNNRKLKEIASFASISRCVPARTATSTGNGSRRIWKRSTTTSMTGKTA